MKSCSRMKVELKKKFLKPGRLLGMNTYLLINRTYLQHLAGLQNPQKFWKPIKVLMHCWISFPVPYIIQKITMLLKRSCLENSLKIAGPWPTMPSEGKFVFWYGGTNDRWPRSRRRWCCCLRCWSWRAARRSPTTRYGLLPCHTRQK